MSITSHRHDALTEIVNVGLGRAADTLSSLVARRIELCVPRVATCGLADLAETARVSLAGDESAVLIAFGGALRGRSALAFPSASGLALTRLVLEANGLADETTDLVEIAAERNATLEEVGNLVLNGVLGSVANIFAGNLTYAVPQTSNRLSLDLLMGHARGPSSDVTCLVADARFQVADSAIAGSLLLLFDSSDLDVLLDRVLEGVAAVV